MLPPAGEPCYIGTDPAATERLLQQWRPYQAGFYASGTAALAAAVSAALAVRPGRRRVLLPGYGCPALVSAVLHAGGKPMLVDLEPERPWMQRAELHARLDGGVAAVVAVNFLGIPERLQELAVAAEAAGALLIEDSAQCFPPAGLAAGVADCIVLSFGRGKPVSLLGGGAVLCRDPALAAALPQPRPAGGRQRLRLKAAAYNLLRRPGLYWIPQLLPLGLGKTRFEPLAGIVALDESRRQAVGKAAADFLRQQPHGQRLVAQGPARVAGLTDVAAVCGGASRLLRYPLLAPDAATRQELLVALRQSGLGASALYEHVLPEVDAMPCAPLVHGELAQARDFAARLLTLPVHSGVRPRHVRRMQQVIETVLAASLPRWQGERKEKPG